ncbi:zinc finger protein 43-like [Octopus sinensis]|uniref:Zinc finger protein 43-like n=1 Tax=Octopus sinensis TaxID=2607531 RepID=A0A7E6FH30_9MOLL|nr:zinc finger protein 43-like [Octopus sinensis]XP_036367034.1 zinc finger protein 43-like [Octopus sinensis]XP_036367035.1 zinc finger protein 43-like [Octopus sinensis]
MAALSPNNENVDRVWLDNNMSQLCYEELPSSNSVLCSRNQALTPSSDEGNISETVAKDIFILNQQTSRDRQPSLMINLKSLQETKRHKCPICAYKTNYKSDLNRHSKKHSKCSFTCDICKMPFMSMGIVMYHKQKHHSEQMSSMRHRYSCSMCPYGTRSKSDLNRHLKLHPLAKYLCYICHIPFNNFETLELHLKTWHPDANRSVALSKTSNIEVPSKTAHDAFSDSDNQNKRSREGSRSPSDTVYLYLQNIDKKGSDQNKAECNYSGRSQIKLETEKFKCTFCSKIFEDQSILDFHILQFHIETQFSLSTGEQLNLGNTLTDSSSSTDANRQEYCEGQQDTLQCSQCVFKTSNQFLLDNHLRKHHVTLYSCSTCNLSFRNVQNLMQHKLQHECQPRNIEKQKGRCKYQCDMCSYETDHKSTFNRHVLRHSVAKYRCDECQMPFMREGNLILHKQRNHSTAESTSTFNKEQRYQCPHCQYASSYKITLQRHVLKHAIALFKCDLCHMPFICQGNLSHHKKLQHGAPVSDNIQDKDPAQHSYLHNFNIQRKLNESKAVSQTNSSFSSTDVINLTQCKPEIYTPYPTAPVICQDERPEVYNVYPVLESEPVVCEDDRPESFLCPYCPTKFASKEDFLKHISSHEGTMYHYTVGTSSLLQQVQFEENMLQQYGNSSSNLSADTGANEHSSLPGAATILTDNLLTISDVSGNTSGFINSASNFQSEESQSPGELNYIEIDDDNNDSDIDDGNNNNNNNNSNNNNNNNNNDNQGGIGTENIRGKERIELGVITLEADERKSTESDVNIEPKQTAALDHGRQNLVECCDKEIQCALISSEGSSTNDSLSASLVQPPQRGRYVKLVSDFDDFAERPFACALCYHRFSKYEELKKHVQNHLTGAGGFEEIPSTALFVSTTSD